MQENNFNNSSSSSSRKQEIKINPYKDRKSAIMWLYKKGIKVVDESNLYHSMSFIFPQDMTTGKELDIIKQFGEISAINFSERIIHVFTATVVMAMEKLEYSNKDQRPS